MRKRGLFLKAYAKIYANKGATTLGTDPADTIQGMSLERIDRIIVQLRNGTYRWKSSRRTHVPKKDGTKRPLSIPNWSDKLVQEVMRMILEAYYEPQFRDSSHGFRPNRSCHTALRDIKHTWTGTKWFIEGDIKGCFDSIPHDTIIMLLGRSIHDNRFLKLVREMLRAGYVDDWQYYHSYSGTPQGGIVSPLLANIVLHELDCYVEDELLPLFTTGKRRKNNREYNCLWEEKRKAKIRDDRKRYKELNRKLRQIPRYNPNDLDYRRLRYVRYADDFLLGFIGPKVEAQHIKSLLGTHLQQLGLTLSEEKTHITHARTQAARFLGYDITTAWDNTKLSKRQEHKVRALNGTIQLRVPREISVKWIRRYTRQGKPHYIGGYIELSDYELVETFGAQLRGLTNYYLMADNVGKALGYVRWVCLESLRKTLAAKHRIRKPAITYQRYYRDGDNADEWRHIQVTIAREEKRPLVAKCGETPLRTRPITYSKDSIPLPVIFGTKSELLTRLLKGACELCGKTADLEAHHINKLKHLQKRWQGKQTKPLWVQFMLARRRKTIVVCQQCHSKITHGKYDGDRL
jgi:group II intron reverse transcriptase/maturase